MEQVIITDTREQPNTNEKSSTAEIEATSIPLMLGDIIKMHAPQNDVFHERSFIIDFINTHKIRLIDTDTLQLSVLNITDDGKLMDTTIREIDLLSRKDDLGYARQNKLLPGVWINIYFGGDVPSTLTGQITDLEEDMIEIKLYPTQETIYINFAYSGIPEDIPIQLIELRKEPEKDLSQQEIEVDARLSRDSVIEEEDDAIDGTIGRKSEDLLQDAEQEAVGEDDMLQDIEGIPQQTVVESVQKHILDANDIVFNIGEEFSPIMRYVDKDLSNVRYSIESQCNDLLDDLLSTIPNSERTHRVLQEIHTTIERYKQLRCRYSTLDEYGNVVDMLKKEDNWKPLIDQLLTFERDMFWILPVVKNVKKTYDISGEIEDMPGDIVNDATLSDIANIRNELDLFNSNTFPDDQNKYTHMIKGLNTYFTPFEPVNPEQQHTVIYSPETHSNITTVVNNLGHLSSSSVHNEQLVNRRFLMQRYNTGTHGIIGSKLNRETMTNTLLNLVNADVLNIDSMITLPYSAVSFSRINLPTTDILTRTMMNESFIQYWRFLNNMTRVKREYIDTTKAIDRTSLLRTNAREGGIDKPDMSSISVSGMATQIKHYTLNAGESSSSHTLDEYKRYLERVVPQTSQLIDLSKDYIRDRLSVQQFIERLEPYFIYASDLTFSHYENIQRFIDGQITDTLKLYVERTQAFFKLQSVKYAIAKNPSAEGITLIVDKKVHNEVFKEAYGYNKMASASNSELLAAIIDTDAGRLYNTTLAFQNISLMMPENVAKLFDASMTNKEMMEEYAKKGDCANYQLAKQYKSIDELETDNHRKIYYDKEYDTTEYGSLDSLYGKEMQSKDPDEFIDFLVATFREKKSLNTEDATYLAETLISGTKRVRDGDYAFIFDLAKEEDNIAYYKRAGDVWILDESVDKAMFVKDNDLFCNLQEKCIAKDNKCESVDDNKNQLDRDAMNEMVDEFDKTYSSSNEEIKYGVKQQLDHLNTISRKINEIRFDKMMKYNNQKVLLGIKNSEEVVPETSPYYNGLNKILKQGDFTKKQNDLIRFTMQFTRKAHADTDESIHWRYCVKTDVPLLPEYRYTLASTFVNDPENFLAVIERLKSTIGKISDDGNAWVDKHSGQIIQEDNFVVEDEYNDGFKTTSREIMEKDAATDIMANLHSTNKNKTPEMKICENIIDVLSRNMGIFVEDYREMMVDLALSVFHSVLPNEKDYNEKVKQAAKDGKKTVSFQDIYLTLILFNTMAVFLIVVQTSIPSIRSRRTFPGCITSFKGFPFEGTGDDSAINYVSCVAYSIRNSTEPWKVLLKKPQTYIATKLKQTIQSYFLAHPTVVRRFNEKAEYLLAAPVESIPEEVDVVNTWIHFLPPLVNFSIKNLTSLTPEFNSKLLSEMRSGYSSQHEHIGVVMAKIIYFSLALQQKIQKVVDRETLLLKNTSNEPFVENACCATSTEIANTLHYFSSKDREITIFNDRVRSLELIMEEIGKIDKAYLFNSPINTKNIYPTVSSQFSEHTVYLLFITYCKLNTVLPVPEYLTKFCNEKPLNIQPRASMDEIIAKLKEDGRHYDMNSAIQLFQSVSREHLFHQNASLPDPGPVQGLRNLLKKQQEDVVEEDREADMRQHDNSYLPLSLVEGMNNILDTYDMVQTDDDVELRALKNMLAKGNAEMKKDVMNFILINGKIRQLSKDKLQRKLDGVLSFDESREMASHQISDSYGYSYINTLRTFATNMVSIYPKIITDRVDYENVKIPSYWHLSRKHNQDIYKIIRDDLSSLKKFYAKNEISNILGSIGKRCGAIVEFMNTTPYFTPVSYKDTVRESIFDTRVSTLLAQYCFLAVFTEYIHMTDDPYMLFVLETNESNQTDLFTTESVREDMLHREAVPERHQREDLLEGDKKIVKQRVAELLNTYLDVSMATTKLSTMKVGEIMDSVFRLKEEEKHMFTEARSNMTEESLIIDKTLKIHKLGDWGKGLEKGVVAYSAEFYDEEKEMMEKIASNIEKAEHNLRNNVHVTNNNASQYIGDEVDDILRGEEIEREEYDMSHMNNDYDDGNYGADEVDDYDDYE